MWKGDPLTPLLLIKSSPRVIAVLGDFWHFFGLTDCRCASEATLVTELPWSQLSPGPSLIDRLPANLSLPV